MKPSAPLSSHDPSTEAVFASVLDWWEIAGVDYGYGEGPAEWLSTAQRPESGASDGAAQTRSTANAAPAKRPSLAKKQPEPAVSRALALGGDKALWPRDLATFATWWLTEEALGERGAFPRVAPRGPADAPVMLLVPEPEEADRDHLLTGQAGQTAKWLLRAMGVAPASAYFASALPRHTPLADWRGLAARGLADIVRHHIEVAQPRRVVALGRPLGSLLADQDDILCGPGLDELQRSAPRRQRFWHEWLEWTGKA